MAEERKKPKIDLKTRIPSKTVKGLSPVAGGAIPPPPGAVPAPPPDLLGRRSMPPKVEVDPNDPLGAAKMSGGPAPQQQIVLVEAAHETHAGSNKGTFYAIVAVVLLAGVGVGFVVGSGSAGRTIHAKAVQDATDLNGKVKKTDDNLEKFRDTLKGAESELDNAGVISAGTIEAIKAFSSGFSAADLKGREIAQFGEETAGKLITYANKVNHIDLLVADLTKNKGLENANAQLKALAVPPKQAKMGVAVDKGPAGSKITMASLVDFGDPLDLASAVTGGKLKTKTGELDVWPGKGDFLEKPYVSAIEGKDWLKACPVYAQARLYTRQGIDDIIVAIEGSGDDPGTVKPGQELADKLKSLAK